MRSVGVVTGAAGVGKSTIGAILTADPRLLVLDGDVLASGAAAVANAATDYQGFWRYVIDIAGEVHRNRMVPVITCVCLPEQVVPAARPDLSLHILALVADRNVREHRAGQRAAGRDLDHVKHESIDRRLRVVGVGHPHSFAVVDSSNQPIGATAEAARRWAERLLGASGVALSGDSPPRE